MPSLYIKNSDSVPMPPMNRVEGSLCVIHPEPGKTYKALLTNDVARCITDSGFSFCVRIPFTTPHADLRCWIEVGKKDDALTYTVIYLKSPYDPQPNFNYR